MVHTSTMRITGSSSAAGGADELVFVASAAGL